MDPESHSRLHCTKKDKMDAQIMRTPSHPTHIGTPRSAYPAPSPSILHTEFSSKLCIRIGEDFHEHMSMEEAFHSTNTLYCSLRSFGFGAHSLLDGADDGGELCWAPKERHSPSNAVRGPEPYFYPSSTSTTTPPSPSPPSPPVPQQFHPSSGPSKEGKKRTSSHVEQRQKLLGALATLLDTDDTGVAVTASGPYLRYEASPSGHIVDRLDVNLIICGAGPYSTGAPSQSDGAEVDTNGTAAMHPLQLLVDQGYHVSLAERAQALNLFFSAASSCGYPSDAFGQVFKQLGRYIAASHAERVVQKTRNNSLSHIIWETFCTLPFPPTHTSKKTKASHQPQRAPAPPATPSSLLAPPFLPAQPQSRPQTTRAARDQEDRDHLFLKRLLNSACQELLEGKVHIPNLTALATPVSPGDKSKRAASTPKGPISGPMGSHTVEIYTEDTRVEFHQLLCWLVGSTEEGYLGALVSFVRLTRDDCQTRGAKGGRQSRKRVDEVWSALNKLTMLGILLRDALASSAFKAHMEAIAPLLVAHRRRIERSARRRSSSQGPGSINGTFGSGVPQFDLSELGRSEENMDFNHAAGLSHAKDLDENEVVVEVYGGWMKALVGHLEAMVVVQKWVMNGGRGCRAHIGTVIGVPRRMEKKMSAYMPGSIEREDGKRAKSDSGSDDESRVRTRKRPKLDHIQHPEAHTPKDASGAMLGPPDAWKEVLTDAFSNVQEYTEVAPDFDTVIELVEELIHRDTLPQGLSIPLAAPKPQSAQWCPEACLATLIHGYWGHTSPSTGRLSGKRKAIGSDNCAAEFQPRNASVMDPDTKHPACRLVEHAGMESPSIGVSRGCCPSCNALLTALVSEPSPSNPVSSSDDVGAVTALSDQLPSTVSANPTKQRSEAPDEMVSQSLWAGSHCRLPKWVSEDLARQAVLEARRSLVRLVNRELAEQFYDLEESEDEDSEVDALESIED